MIVNYKKIIKLYRLFKRGYGEYKARMTIMFFLGFIGLAMEGIGLTMLIPLFSFASKDSSASQSNIYKILSEIFTFFGLAFSIKNLLFVICILFFIKAVVQFCSGYINTRIITSYELGNKRELFKMTMKSNWSYLSKQKIGHLTASLITDVDRSSQLFNQLSSVLISIISLIVYTFLIFSISASVATSTIVLMVLIFFFLKPLFYKSRMLATESGRWFKNLSHFINQTILGMKSIKAMAVEKAIIKEADRYFEDYRSLTFKTALFGSLMTSITQPVGMLFIVLIFVFLYKFVGFNYGSFTVIIYAVYKVFIYLQNAQIQIQKVNTMAPYLVNLLSYKEQTGKYYEEDKGGKEFIFKDALEFQDVGFSYSDNQIVLDGVNMVFQKGETTGVIGPSGAGKTTLVDLILRLYKQQSGRILLDNEEISQIDLETWRNNIGYVSQDLFLMNDTIANNIKFYRDDVSDENMVEAARMSNIYDFIEGLPKKFATVIGERGILLSNGQRQRIVLSRILAKKPEVIILDEATSALDNETEIFVQKAIESLKGKITIIVIAHRLTTVYNVDNIYALKDGAIIESGQPQELLKDENSYFSKMFNINKEE